MGVRISNITGKPVRQYIKKTGFNSTPAEINVIVEEEYKLENGLVVPLGTKFKCSDIYTIGSFSTDKTSVRLLNIQNKDLGNNYTIHEVNNNLLNNSWKVIDPHKKFLELLELEKLNQLKPVPKDHFKLLNGYYYTGRIGKSGIIGISLSPTNNCQLFSIASFQSLLNSDIDISAQIKIIKELVGNKPILLCDLTDNIMKKFHEKIKKDAIISITSYISTNGHKMNICLINTNKL